MIPTVRQALITSLVLPAQVVLPAADPTALACCGLLLAGLVGVAVVADNWRTAT